MTKIIITSQLPDCPDARRVRTELINDGDSPDDITIIDYSDLADGIAEDCELIILVIGNDWQDDEEIDSELELTAMNGCRIAGVWACDAIINAHRPTVMRSVASACVTRNSSNLANDCKQGAVWQMPDGTKTDEDEFKRYDCEKDKVVE